MSKEVRIGLLVTISLVVFFVGFYFLKGADVFSGEKEYSCFYSNVQGLQTSANVQIRGLNVGHVSRTQLIDNKGVRVTIALKKNVELPRGTKAILASSDLLGSKMIRLDLGEGPGLLDPGSELPAGEEGGIIDNISVQINPLLTQLRAAVSSLDTVLIGAQGLVNSQNQKVISAALASFDSSMRNIQMLSYALKKESGEVAGVIHNANSITGNLASSNDTIRHILNNLSATTGQLAHAPIRQTFDDLQSASTDIHGIINKINSDQGSLGMLINNKDLYHNLTSSLNSLNLLIGDVQAHPTRYINVTIFGKKKSE